MARRVAALLDNLASGLRSSAALSDEGLETIRDSLAGRVMELRRESVRQAILRTVGQELNDEAAVKFIDGAYGVRSKILHEGLRAVDLHELSNGVEAILRRMYSSIVGLPLSRALPPT